MAVVVKREKSVSHSQACFESHSIKSPQVLQISQQFKVVDSLKWLTKAILSGVPKSMHVTDT